MAHERLFVCQIVMAMENQWFLDWGAPPVRTERKYYIEQYLFAAADEEAAYERVDEWVRGKGLTDSNNDLGGGGHTEYFPIGIHQLEEVAFEGDKGKGANEYYGISLPNFDLEDVDQKGVPSVRRKEELEVFNPHRLRPSGGIA